MLLNCYILFQNIIQEIKIFVLRPLYFGFCEKSNSLKPKLESYFSGMCGIYVEIFKLFKMLQNISNSISWRPSGLKEVSFCDDTLKNLWRILQEMAHLPSMCGSGFKYCNRKQHQIFYLISWNIFQFVSRSAVGNGEAQS